MYFKSKIQLKLKENLVDVHFAAYGKTACDIFKIFAFKIASH